jgi:hypothetical protein
MHLQRLDPGTDRDLELMGRLLAEAPDYLLKHFQRFSTADQARDIAQSLPPGCRAEDRRLFAAFERDQPLALVEVILHFPHASVATIGGLAVSRKERRDHVGCRVIEQLSKQARQWPGISTWSLTVAESNVEALQFWAHCGFGNAREGMPTRGLDERVLIMDRALKGRPYCRRSGQSPEPVVQQLARHCLLMAN